MRRPVYEVCYDGTAMADAPKLCFYERIGERVGSAFSLKRRYSGLSCPGCGQIDQILALRSGFDRMPELESLPLDFLVTEDGVVLVSHIAIAGMRQIAGVEFEEFPVSGNSRFSAIYPAHTLAPPNDARVVSDFDEPWQPGELFRLRRWPCRHCGRPRETDCQPHLVALSEDVAFVGLRCRHRDGFDTLVLLVNQVAADIINEQRWRGMQVKQLFRDGIDG